MGVASEGSHTPLRLDIGQGQDGARCPHRPGQGEQRGGPDIGRAGVVGQLVQQPVRIAGGVLDAATGRPASASTGTPGAETRGKW